MVNIRHARTEEIESTAETITYRRDKEGEGGVMTPAAIDEAT